MRYFLLIIVSLFSLRLEAQVIPLSDYSRYPFIVASANELSFGGDSSTFNRFVEKLNHLQIAGDNTVRILHIGDSHIQADIFSGKVRELMQLTFPGGNGGLELVFPYRAAKTNGPAVYSSSGTGVWITQRNVQENAVDLDLLGISMSTYDSMATFQLNIRDNNPVIYDFQEVKIMSQLTPDSYHLRVNGLLPEKTDTLAETVISTYRLLNFSDNITCSFATRLPGQKSFTLTGVLLNQETPGIIYNTAGVNGAEVRSFLRCNQLLTQVKFLHPDLIVVSLGTNDCYSVGWDRAAFEKNMEQFVVSLKETSPESAIILTTPADNYRRRRYPNNDLPAMREILFRIARQHKLIVWDLYTVMGGKNSMLRWLNSGLAARDKVHFSQEGYLLQGNLLFEAILESYTEFNSSKNAN